MGHRQLRRPSRVRGISLGIPCPVHGGPSREENKKLAVQSRDMAAASDKLYSKYGKHALPEQEGRKIIDQAMGSQSLTDALDVMRNG